MTIEEAIAEAREGKAKITHAYFNEREWVKIQGARVVFEDGVSMYVDEFLAIRSGEGWKTDREVFPE